MMIKKKILITNYLFSKLPEKNEKPLKICIKIFKNISLSVTNTSRPGVRLVAFADRSSNFPLSRGADDRLLDKKEKFAISLEKFNSNISSNTEKNKDNKILTGETNIGSSYSKLHELKLINIGLASAKRIKQWSEKTLPNGKVIGQITNANTLHHKTLKPQKGGLFCERIFGPLKDFECACGKNQKPTEEKQQKIFEHQQLDRIFCPKCDVEYTWSVIRRYQLGYIQLVSPVTHAWYLKATPSYLSILLDIKKRHLEYIVYSSETMTLEYSQKLTEQQYNSPANLFKIWQKSIKNSNTSNQGEQLELNTSLVGKYHPILKISDRSLTESTKIKLESQQIKSPNINSLLQIDTNSISTIKQKKNIVGLRIKYIKPKRCKGWRNILANLNKNHANLFAKDSNSQKSLLPSTKICSDFPTSEAEIEALSVNISQNFKSFIPNYFNKYCKCAKNLTTQNFKFIPIIIYILNRIQKLASKKSRIFLTEELFKQFYTKIYVLAYKKFKKYIVKNSKKVKLILNNEIITTTSIIKRLKNSTDSLLTINDNVPNQKFDKFFIYKKFLYKLLTKTKFFRNKTFTLLNKPNFCNDTIRNNCKITNRFFNFVKFQLIPLSKKFIDNNWNSFLNQIDLKLFLNLTCSNLYCVLGTLEKRLINKAKNSQISSHGLTQESYFRVTERVSYFAISEKVKKVYIYSLNINQIAFLITNIIINILLNKMNKIITNESNKIFNFLIKEKLPENLLKNYYKTNQLFTLQDLLGGTPSKTSRKKTKFFQTVFKNQKIISLNNSLFIKERLYDSTINNLVHTSLVGKYDPIEIKTLTSLSNNPKSITNNIYCLSHRYRWSTEKDWKQFIDYFGSVPDLTDNPIPNYKIRIKNSQNLSNESGITGTLLIQKLLEDFNFTELKKIDKQNRILLYELNKNLIRLKKALKKSYGDRQKKRIFKELYKKRDALIRRTKLIRKLFRKDSSPNSMILSILPVLPPDLRPIIKVGGQIAASDLNRLYQRVIYRNERLKKFLKDPATINSYEMKYAQRLLQEAVDNLIQNGNSGLTSEKDAKGRVLKSLSDVLKGKQGRFRQHLLGKRVDYSGRSVIVVGPKLKLYECGLPKEMALELFLPFIIKKIISLKLARTVIGAKTLIKNNKEVTYDILREIMINHPILLNRAPTLHRLGIQAFQPKLVEGRAILLHPLVCPAFNADFDGDQMAVHVPITVESRTEAWKLMFSRNNLLSPATGEPIVLPSQDMVLGCYYLTTENFKANLTKKIYFSNFIQVLKAYKQGKIGVHTIVWVRYNNLVESGTEKEEPIEIRITDKGNWTEIYKKIIIQYNSNFNKITQFIKTTPGRILFNELINNSINNLL
jgi:DNA-directed RNA polymerase beta' subunit